MKKFAFLAMLALELAMCGCGTSSNSSTTTNTEATGNWEAQLTGGTEQTSLMNFVTTFTVTNSGPLNITGFGFFNSGACFTTGANAETVTGNATFTTTSTNSVTGTLNLTVTSATTGAVLTLQPGTLTGTSNGTTTTTGTLSNGVVIGNWNLTAGSNSQCSGSMQGSYILCQGTATCSTTAAASVRKPD